MTDPDCIGSIRPIAPPTTSVYVRSGSATDGRLVGAFLRDHRHSRHLVIADQMVHSILGRDLVARWRHEEGVDLVECLVPPAEASKSAQMYWRLVDQALEAGIDRDSYVITVGGGVVNNLGGFVAATLLRGLPLIHLPTSLMAQLDAAIDVRQAINHDCGKNLVGCLYAPRAVVVDPNLLCTLPARHLRSGVAEAIKHSLTQSRRFWQFLNDHARRLREPTFLEHLVRETIRWKLELMNLRTPETTDAYLQYGHCLGHAMETASGHSLLHGEAIAIGMTLSAQIARSMGLCSHSLVLEHSSIFQAYELPVTVPRCLSIDAIMNAIRYDKYSRQSTPRMALLQDIGHLHCSTNGAFVSVRREVVREHLERSQRQGLADRGAANA